MLRRKINCSNYFNYKNYNNSLNYNLIRKRNISLNKLNELQKKIVISPLNSVIICSAGPGSGKVELNYSLFLYFFIYFIIYS